MNGDDFKPMAPALEQLLEAERARPDPPREMKERIYARLEASGASGAGGAGGPGVTDAAAAPSVSPAAATLGYTRFLQPLPLTAVVLATSGLVAVGVMSTSDRRNPPTNSIALTQRVQQKQPAAPPVTEPLPAPQIVAEVAPAVAEPTTPTKRPPRRADDHAATPPAPAPAVEQRGTTLAGEQILLEQARAALGQGQSAQAIAALHQHARTYPRGVLVEEREGLWVKALLVAGDTAAAHTRAQRFVATYPRSIFLPIVQPALE